MLVHLPARHPAYAVVRVPGSQHTWVEVGSKLAVHAAHWQEVGLAARRPVWPNHVQRVISACILQSSTHPVYGTTSSTIHTSCVPIHLQAQLGKLVRFNEVLAFKGGLNNMQRGRPFLRDVVVEGLVSDEFEVSPPDD